MQNESLEDEVIKEFKPYEIESLTKENILSDVVMNYLIGLPNSTDKIREIELLRGKAQSLKVLRAFNSIFKQKNQDYIQDLKSKGGHFINFTDCPLKNLKCGQWIADDTGVYKMEYSASMQPIKIKASPIPVLPVERLVNIDTNIEKVKLAFFKDGKWQEIIAEKNTIVSKNKILQLANRGLEVTEEIAKNLISYLSEVLEMNNIAMKKGASHLGWIDDEFIPYTDEYCLDIDQEFRQKLNGIRSSGTYEVWKNYVKKLRKNSTTLRFMIASSFASILVKVFRINTFIVHLWGKSGNGKTVAEMICASIWGKPDNNYISNLSNTTIANERLCNFYRNLPIILDELQIAKARYKNFDELIYVLTEGKGKERGTTDNGVREQTTWQTVIILNGEEPITSDTSKEGIKNRVIEINEDDPIIENGNETVQIIQNNYGFAGKEFIKLIENREELEKIRKHFINELDGVIQYKKQINAYSIIAVADYIVSKKLFNDKPLTIREIESYVTKDTDEADRYYEKILEWFYQNINKFKESEALGEIWGKYEVLGDEIATIYIIPKVLYDFLKQNDVNFNGIKKKMWEKGYISKDVQNKYTIPVKINKVLCRCIKFNAKPIRTDLQFEEEYEIKTDEELPF